MAFVADDKVYLTNGDRNGNNAAVITYDLKTKNFATTPIKLKDKAIWSLNVKNDKIYIDVRKNLNDEETAEAINSGYFGEVAEEYVHVYDAKTCKLLNTINVNASEYDPNAYGLSSFMVIAQD